MRDETGGAVENTSLVLRPAETGNGRYRWAFGRTGPDGNVAIVGVEPGRYRIQVGTEDRARFVDPDNNPLASPPAVTVPEGVDTVIGEVELWRGVEINCRVVADGVNKPGAVVHFDELDRGLKFTLKMGELEEKVIRIVPGRWRLWSEARSGYLLVDVDHDGRGVEGFAIDLDLARGDPRVFAGWTYHSPARLWGRVDFVGDKFPLGVVATLVEPGPWIERVRARGGSRYEEVYAGVDGLTSEYEMSLPDGSWIVRPESDGLESSEPASAPLTIGPGETRRLDWSVRGSYEGGGYMLVRLADPVGRRTGPGFVEVWPLNATELPEEPLARAQVKKYGSGFIRPISAGDYRVVGQHADYLLGERRLPAWDPEDDEQRRVTVRLQKGASIHVIAVGEDEQPVPGVRLALRDDDGPPPGLGISDRLLEKLMHKQTTADSTGHAWLKGLYPGSYTLTGKLIDGDPGRRVVFEEESDELSLSIVGDEEREVVAHVVPAGSVHGELHCSDGGPLDPAVDLMIVEAAVDPAGWDEAELVRESGRRAEDVLLEGRERREFVFGPVPEGSFRLAVRPEGHDRWTWALGTEEAAEAAVLQSIAGSPTEVQTVTLDCGPVLWVTPTVLSGQPLPDLRNIARSEDLLVVTGTVTPEDGQPVEIDRVRLDVRADRIGVRGLPVGRADLELRLGSGFFLREPWIALGHAGDLKRGADVRIDAPIDGIGGVILIETDHAAVRLQVAEDDIRLAEVEEEVVYLASIPRGTYTVELCRDESCETTGEGLVVDVKPGEISRAEAPR